LQKMPALVAKTAGLKDRSNVKSGMCKGYYEMEEAKVEAA